jgi:uncharacterized protein YlxW (UPF0749 family)
VPKREQERDDQGEGEGPSQVDSAASAFHPVPPGVKRQQDALARPRRSQLVVAVLLAVLGFAFVAQVRTYDQDDPNTGLREDELVRLSDGLSRTAERARREVGRLEVTLDDLRSENASREEALAATEQRAKDLSFLAGLAAVQGPGVRVTITETDGRVSVGSLLDTVQELRTADAEAMELNDAHRFTAQSSFEQAVGGIELDDEPLESPYVLEAVGDPAALEGALGFAMESLMLDGASVRVERLDIVKIESLAELPAPVHAEPVEPQQPAS